MKPSRSGLQPERSPQAATVTYRSELRRCAGIIPRQKKHIRRSRGEICGAHVGCAIMRGAVLADHACAVVWNITLLTRFRKLRDPGCFSGTSKISARCLNALPYNNVPLRTYSLSLEGLFGAAGFYDPASDFREVADTPR